MLSDIKKLPFIICSNDANLVQLLISIKYLPNIYKLNLYGSEKNEVKTKQESRV